MRCSLGREPSQTQTHTTVMDNITGPIGNIGVIRHGSNNLRIISSFVSPPQKKIIEVTKIKTFFSRSDSTTKRLIEKCTKRGQYGWWAIVQFGCFDLREDYINARDFSACERYHFKPKLRTWKMTPILSLVKSSTLLPRLKSTNCFTFVEPAAISLSRVCENQRPLSQFRIQTRKCCLLSFILLCSDQRGRRTADGLQAQVMSVLDNVTSFLFRLHESFEFTDNE